MRNKQTRLESAQGQNKDYLMFIAYAQIIGIILVVLGHSFHEFPDGKHGATLLIYRMCYNFHMPLFMFLSGFLLIYTTFGNNNYPSPTKFIKKKVLRLLIPYFVLTLVTYTPRALISDLADDSMDFSLKGALEAFFLTDHLPIPYFWFLQSSFLLLVLIYTIIYISRLRNFRPSLVYCLLFCTFLFTPFISMPSVEVFGINSMMRLGIYFILGVIYCEYYDRINNLIPLDSIGAFITTFLIWLILFLIGENPWIYRVASAFGIAMCICASKLLVKYDIKFLNHLRGANYIIFLLSWYFNVLFQQILGHYISLPWWIHSLMSLVFGIYIPWLFYRYMLHRSEKRYVRTLLFLLGHKIKPPANLNK